MNGADERDEEPRGGGQQLLSYRVGVEIARVTKQGHDQ